MKLLLSLVFLSLAFGQPITDEQRVLIQNEHQMVQRYNEMLAAMQDFAEASNAFAKLHNQGGTIGLGEARAVEIKADLFCRAWQRTYQSEGWISTSKVK